MARPVPELLFNIFLRWNAMASFQPASVFGVATMQVTTMFTLQELLSNGLRTRQSVAACYRIPGRYCTANGRVPDELHRFIDRHDSKLKQPVLCHRASGQPRAWISSRANTGQRLENQGRRKSTIYQRLLAHGSGRSGRTAK